MQNETKANKSFQTRCLSVANRENLTQAYPDSKHRKS